MLKTETTPVHAVDLTPEAALHLGQILSFYGGHGLQGDDTVVLLFAAPRPGALVCAFGLPRTLGAERAEENA